MGEVEWWRRDAQREEDSCIDEATFDVLRRRHLELLRRRHQQMAQARAAGAAGGRSSEMKATALSEYCGLVFAFFFFFLCGSFDLCWS
jgi:hypothetical protein